MSDVSNRLLEFYEDQAQRHGLPLERVFEGTGLTVEQMSDPSGFVPWNDYANLANRLESLIGVEETIAAGMRIPEHDFSAPTRALSAALARPSQLYEAVFRWLAPLMFRNLQFEVSSPSTNRVEIQVTIPEPGTPSLAWMHMAEGSFRTLPGILGLDDAVVRATVAGGGQKGTFDVLVPASETFIDRMRRRARIAFAPSALLNLLAEMQLDLREAYTDVAAHERDLRELVESLPDPVALCIGDRVHLANRSWRRALGDEPSLEALFGDHELPREVVAGGRIYERADTGPRDAGASDDRQLVVLRDVTEARREAQRQMLTDRLTSLGTMAASVGHELNNPLTYVSGAIDLLQVDVEELDGDALRDAAREAVEMASEGLARMRQITADLRLFVRGATSDSDEEVNLPEVVQSTLRMAHAELRGVQVEAQLDEGLLVSGRTAQLGQVVLNLVLNASQAMHRAGIQRPELHITAREHEGAVELWVQDNGPGLPTDHERLFEPFYTTRKDGTGLGLAICRRLVEEHGGTLVADPGEVGARFVMRLPPASLGAPAPRRRRSEGRRRVLFVDDEVALGVLVRRMLPDHEVTTFSDPTEALAWATDHADAIDVLLCDVRMPELSGPDLVERLPSRLKQRVVWVTGGTGDDETNERLAGRRILDKPFRKESLLDVVEAMDPSARNQAG